jgi:hypothetical protein
VEKNYVIAEGKLVNCFYNWRNVFCTTITDLRSLAFQVGELNHFPHTPNKDGYLRDEIVLWVHETTSITKSESATRSPGQQVPVRTEYVNSSVCLKELRHTVDAIRIYV